MAAAAVAAASVNRMTMGCPAHHNTPSYRRPSPFLLLIPHFSADGCRVMEPLSCRSARRLAGSSWTMQICVDGKKSVSRRSKKDAGALTIVQLTFHDLIKHAMGFYLCYKNLQSQFVEFRISRNSAAHDWLKLIPLLSEHVKRKTVLAVLGSVMAGILLMVGAPVLPSSPITWALTEENLIFLEAWRTIDRAYIDKTFNGQSWFRYREDALRREPMKNREETWVERYMPQDHDL